MERLELFEAAKLTSPNPLTLVCTRTKAGITNLATISWWTYLGLAPATIGFSMMKQSFSGETIRDNKNAILTIPGEPLARHVMECGSCSGRDVDKVARFNIAMKEVPGNDIKIPEHSVVAIFGTLREYVDIGDHYFYIMDVKDVLADKNETALFAWKGYVKIAPAHM